MRKRKGNNRMENKIQLIGKKKEEKRRKRRNARLVIDNNKKFRLDHSTL
jgi:hypothetical protein